MPYQQDWDWWAMKGVFCFTALEHFEVWRAGSGSQRGGELPHIKEIKQVEEEESRRMCSWEAENMLSIVRIMQLFYWDNEDHCFMPKLQLCQYSLSLVSFQTLMIFFFTLNTKLNIFNPIPFAFTMQWFSLWRNETHSGLEFSFFGWTITLIVWFVNALNIFFLNWSW